MIELDNDWLLFFQMLTAIYELSAPFKNRKSS